MSGNQLTHIDDDHLGEILDEILAQYARGEVPQIDAYAQGNLEIAAILRQAVPALRAVGAATENCDTTATLRRLTGNRLGDFHIRRELGHGGMGVVYEADQLSMGRRVALKVLPFAGIVQEKALQRFRNEVRAAATLDHPHIVPVYSVGEERGIHFYAMKLIHGQPLSQVIAELARLKKHSGVPTAQSFHQALSGCSIGNPDDEDDSCEGSSQACEQGFGAAETTKPEQMAFIETWDASNHRREYFRTLAHIGWQAAQALEHAHEHGVLHRDIKPGNLMLDANINVFVTDFGLAHIETDTALTMTGDLIGTLRYMSPEQALANRAALDGRTDVYSLGATLYELLALRPVFTSTNRQHLLQQIALEEPRKLRSIDRSIPSELETIVHKAIEKRPEDRYSNAAELAGDLRAFLDDREILARPPTLVEKAVKWTRRHTALAWSILISSGLILMLTLLGLVLNNILIADQRRVAQEQTKEAELQAALASAVIEYINTDLLGTADPWNEPDRDIRLRTVLDRASAGIDNKLQGQPLVAANLRLTFGKTYRSLGEFEIAEEHIRAAYEVFRGQLGEDQRTTQECSRLLAGVLLDQGKDAESEQLTRRILNARLKDLGNEHPDTLQSMHDLAELSTFCGRYSLAKRFFKHVVQVREKLLGKTALSTLDSKQGLAEVLIFLNELQAARQMLTEAANARRQILGAEHPQVLRSRQSVAILYLHEGDNRRAKEEFAALLEIATQTLGTTHPFTISSKAYLATACTRLGELQQSGTLHREIVQQAEDSMGELHPGTLRAELGMAEYLAACQDFQAAVELYNDTLSRMQEVFGETYVLTSMDSATLAKCYEALGRFGEADQVRESLAAAASPEAMVSTMILLSEPISDRARQRVQRNRELALQGISAPNAINGLTGLLINGTRAYTEFLGQAYQFDGVDDRLILDDLQELAFTNSFTIECWIRVDSFPDQQQRQSCIVFRGDHRPGLDPYFLQLQQGVVPLRRASVGILDDGNACKRQR